MEQTMDLDLDIIHPRARLEMSVLHPASSFLAYDQAVFVARGTADGWWQRVLALDAYHWVRLSGDATVSPWDALCLVLASPHRPALPVLAVPVLLLLSIAENPDIDAHRQVFRSVSWGLHELHPLLPRDQEQVGGGIHAAVDLHRLAHTSIDAMLGQHTSIPWPERDGSVVQMLRYLATELWMFPPDLVRRIVTVMATQWARPASQGAAYVDDGSSVNMGDVWADTVVGALLGMLSGIRLWERPSLTVRGLPVEASPIHLVPVWYQALLLMHPDAPAIDDAQLAWLCDGTLGSPYAPPFRELWSGISRTGIHSSAWMIAPTQVAALRQEARAGGQFPFGQWEEPISPAWPLLHRFDIQRMRVVATGEGCWVRLLPASASWGSVLWWSPDAEPPASWAVACQHPPMSPPIQALHATFWTLWRNLCVTGQP